MKVRDRLAPILSNVRDHPVPPILEPSLTGHLGGCREEGAGQRPIGGLKVGQRGQMALRDHENMNRSLRMDIPECQHVWRFEHDIGGEFSPRDTAEDAVHGLSFPVLMASG